MPLDVMQQIDEEKRALASSGDNSELVGSLTEIQEKELNRLKTFCINIT